MRAISVSLIASILIAFTAVFSACDTSYVDSTDHMNEGIKLYSAGQISKALDELKKAIEIYPENHKAHYQMGMIYNSPRVSDFVKAAEAFKRATEISKDNGEYWYYLGAANHNEGNKLVAGKRGSDAVKFFEAGRDAFIQAVSADEYYAEAYYRLAQIYRELGDISKAIDAYSNSINSDPTLTNEQGTAIGYLELGMLYLEYSFLDEALQVLRNGVANNPDDVQLQAQLGNVYLAQDRFEEANHHFEKSYETQQRLGGPNEHILPALYGLGLSYASLGDAAMLKSDIGGAMKQYEESSKWFDTFIANASGDSLQAQRIAATGKVTEVKEMMKELKEGKLPQFIIDRQKMESAPK